MLPKLTMEDLPLEIEMLKRVLCDSWNADLHDPGLPWEVKMFWTMTVGTILGLVLILSPRILPGLFRKIGRLKYGHPNWISFWRAPVILIGALIYSWISVFTGFEMIVAGIVMDSVDGQVARLTGLTSKFGDWWDPFIDKFTLIPLMLWLHLHSWFDNWQMASMVVLEFISQTMRPMPEEVMQYLYGKMWFCELVNWLDSHPRVKRMQVVFAPAWAVVKLVRSRVRTGKANGFGKLKYFAYTMSALACFPHDQHWQPDELMAYFDPSVVFDFVLGSALLSILSKVHINRTIDKTVDIFTVVFNISVGDAIRLFIRLYRRLSAGARLQDIND